MNVEFKRDLNHNYIKIESEEEYFDYQVQMIVRNNIEGLLGCTKECVNNRTSFLYEINSKQPFIQVFQRSKLTFEMFKTIISSIKNIVDIMADYMLDVNSLVLSPEYMYMNPETKKVELIYLPGSWNEIKEEFHDLSRKLLDWIDYKDEQVVSSAYELYRLTGEENYTLSDIFSTIFSSESISTTSSAITSVSNVAEELSVSNNTNGVGASFENSYMETNEDFVFESDVEDVIEKESVLKKITKPIIEATSNLFKSFSSKSKNEEVFGYESEESVGYSNMLNQEFDFSTDRKVGAWGDSRSFSMVAEEDAGYGDTVFFQEEVSGNGRLIPVDRDKYDVFELDIFPFIIGKLNDAVDGVIKDESVSRIHGKIERQDLEFYIVDLNSTNGTYLNGRLVSPNEKAKLHSGDRIQFGLVEYIFET